MTAATNLADSTTDGATGEHSSPAVPTFITAAELKRPPCSVGRTGALRLRLTAIALAAALGAVSATPATAQASSTGASSKAAISHGYGLVPRARVPLPRLPNPSRVRARAQERGLPRSVLRRRNVLLRELQRVSRYLSRVNRACKAFRLVFGYPPPRDRFRDRLEQEWHEFCASFGLLAVAVAVVRGEQTSWIRGRAEAAG